MRVILAGQKAFGRAVLEALTDAGHEIAGVVAPDGDGEGDRLWNAALRDGYRPGDRLVSELSAGWVAELEADLIVCAHSHAYVGRKSRAATKLGAVGYHPSLLPRHRGRDAVEWTIRMGDPVAGGSVYWFDDGVDTGPVAAQEWVWVGRHETASELWREKLFPLGVDLLGRVLKDLDNGIIRAAAQPAEFATWEPALTGQRLYRPELPQLGDGPEGYTVVPHLR